MWDRRGGKRLSGGVILEEVAFEHTLEGRIGYGQIEMGR